MTAPVANMDARANRPLDARIARSRSRLRHALMARLAHQRLEEVTVADIVADAGVGYTTFFRHYADKQALWQELADDLIQQMSRRITPLTAHNDHRGAAMEICRLVAAERDAYRILITGGAAEHAREAMIRATLRLVEEDPTRATSGLPVTLGTYFAVNGMFAILAWWLEDHQSVSIETIAGALDRLVYAPLMSPAAQAPLDRPEERPA